MNCNKVPYDGGVESGTTNSNAITYKRKGNLVMVSMYSYYTGSTGSNDITGLPRPAGGAYFVTSIYQSNGQTVAGCMEYFNSKWVCVNNTTNSCFVGFSYLTDEA